jgi:hypothetical protein
MVGRRDQRAPSDFFDRLRVAIVEARNRAEAIVRHCIYVNVDPLMDELRSDPRFETLCRRTMAGASANREPSPDGHP